MREVEEYQVREYPLEVERTTEDAYWSKGWHHAEEFLESFRFEADDIDDTSGYQASDVRYEVWRCLPAPEDAGCNVFLMPGKLGSQGAFPVTVVY